MYIVSLLITYLLTLISGWCSKFCGCRTLMNWRSASVRYGPERHRQCSDVGVFWHVFGKRWTLEHCNYCTAVTLTIYI